jgi:integrase
VPVGHVARKENQLAGIRASLWLICLRHTHATLALQAGVHPKVVQERLGHATIGITLDIYSHTIPAQQADAATAVAALIQG